MGSRFAFPLKKEVCHNHAFAAWLPQNKGLESASGQP
jgi:hypothetical protein